MEEKQNQGKPKLVFGKKTATFLLVLLLGWGGLSRADLGGPNIFEDTDQDGLTDSEELALGTDPSNSDTDADSYMDGVEVESGYDPLKPAPGDRLIPEIVEESLAETEETIVAGEEDEKATDLSMEDDKNLTEAFLTQLEQQKSEEIEIFNEISENPSLVSEEDTIQKLQEISLTSDELEEILNANIDSSDVTEELELIPEEDLLFLPEIEEDDEEKKKEEEKRQIQEYVTIMAFLAAEHSPVNVSEEDDLSAFAISLISNLSGYIDMGNTSKLSQYKKKTAELLNEMKKVEAPYVLKDIHILGLSLVNYVIEDINEEAVTDESDPMEVLLSLGKIQAVLSEFDNLGTKLETIMEEYQITVINQSDSGARDSEEK